MGNSGKSLENMSVGTSNSGNKSVATSNSGKSLENMSEGTSKSAGSIKSTGTSVKSVDEDLVVLFDRDNDHDDLEDKHERDLMNLKRKHRDLMNLKRKHRDLMNLNSDLDNMRNANGSHDFMNLDRKHRHERDLMILADSNCNDGLDDAGLPCKGTSTKSLVNLRAHAKATRIMKKKTTRIMKKKNMFLY